jgi:hypothetical protein
MRSTKRFARTVAQLCPAVPFSRSEYYRLRKMPGAPLPRSDSTHSIEEWREFARKEKSARAPSEKEALELEILRLKAERAKWDLDEARERTRSEILADLMSQFIVVLNSMRLGLERMKSRLAPVFEGRNARSIYDCWTGYEQTLFIDVRKQIERETGVRLDDEALRQYDSRNIALAKNRVLAHNGNGKNGS